MDEETRNNVEQIIKEFSLDRKRVFEVPKYKYKEIIKSIERTFVKNDKSIHWANLGHYKPELTVQYVDCGDDMLWFKKLNKIVLKPENAVYVLLEEWGRGDDKYWVYEMHLKELILILSELEFLEDYYIISKKLDWLISENHHMLVSFVGDKFDLSCLQ